MLKIAICDNNILFCRRIENLISDYCSNIGIDCDISLFLSGSELISLGTDIDVFNIIYLDTDMDGFNGIMTAKAIRKLCREMYIVFVTANIDYAIDGYKVDAIRYILKDNRNIKTNVCESIDAILNKMNKKKEGYEFFFREGHMSLHAEQIVYVESSLHTLQFKVVVRSEEKMYTMSKKLDDIDNLLPDNEFIRIHQSYLVNTKYIKEVTNYNAIMWNGDVLPVSRKRFKGVKHKYLCG